MKMINNTGKFFYCDSASVFLLTLWNTKKIERNKESFKKEVKFELVIKILIYWQWK